MLIHDSPKLDLPSGPNDKLRYKIKSLSLSFSGTVLTYHDGKRSSYFDFSDLYLSATAAHPLITRLSDYSDHVDTMLAATDFRIARSRDGRPTVRSLTRQFYLIRHLIDWLRPFGIYRLGDATPGHTRDLLAQLASGGWAHALSIEARWHGVIDRLERGCDLGAIFGIWPDGRIDGLRDPFWRAQLAWGGRPLMPVSAKARLDELIRDKPSTERWKARNGADCRPPTTLALSNTIGWLNDLAALPASIDRLEHKVARGSNTSAKSISKKNSTRTANLLLSEAISLITKSLDMIYETAPLLIELYGEARTAFPELSDDARKAWLHNSSSKERLEKVVKRPITSWALSGHNASNSVSVAVEEVLGAVQGATTIVLGSMNARRQLEICDRDKGLRVGDLAVLDESLGLYQCLFFIEKTYRARHLFYVNRTSADALRFLERLKQVCLPSEMTLSNGSSLYNCGRFTAQYGLGAERHFAFVNKEKKSRSLGSFFKLAYGDISEAPDLTSHMFRRFFAILYMHRYEHAELRALKQHLRHLDVAMTRVYVTDPSNRPLAEQIASALEQDRYDHVKPALAAALNDEIFDIQIELEAVGKEKLRMAVEEILTGSPTAGGFSKIIRKLYRQILNHVMIEQSDAADPADRIITLLDNHRYRVIPMEHGQCHAPDLRRTLKGACEEGGVLARENASPRVCGGCAFHFNNPSYIRNLKDRLSDLEAERDDFLLSPHQQARAEFDYDNLKKIILLAEKQMIENSRAIADLSSGHSKVTESSIGDRQCAV